MLHPNNSWHLKEGVFHASTTTHGAGGLSSALGARKTQEKASEDDVETLVIIKLCCLDPCAPVCFGHLLKPSLESGSEGNQCSVFCCRPHRLAQTHSFQVFTVTLLVCRQAFTSDSGKSFSTAENLSYSFLQNLPLKAAVGNFC